MAALGAATLLASGGACAEAAEKRAGPKPPSREFYGVAPQRLPGSADIDRMGEGRVGTLRFQLRWSAVDPGPPAGDYDWGEVDQVVGDAARNGIRPLPFVYSTPAWVATLLDGRECDFDCFAYPPSSELALDAWAGFLADAARRYGPEGEFWAEHPELPAMPIHAWQIWNEQNSPPFFRPRPSVSDYARLLSLASAAIRSADPGARIVLGGMFATPHRGRPPALSAWEFLRKLYRSGLPPATFDAVASHPYSLKVEGVHDQLQRLRQVMRRHNDRRKQLWVTEIGWSSAHEGHPLSRGPGGQANRLRQLIELLLSERGRLRLRRVVWFSWRDDTGGLAVCDWCPLSGLFKEAALRPKPAWRAFMEFTGGD